MCLLRVRLVVAASLTAVLFMGGCGGAAKPPATPQCTLDSNCKDPLKCVQGYCVTACAESRDCPTGERCITTDVGNTCQPPEKKTCGANSDCDPLFCAIDLVCRNQCTTNHDCPGGDMTPPTQLCTASKRCIDPVLDSKNYDPATNDLRPPGSNGTGGSGASNGGGGAGSGTGGRNGSAGTGGGNNGGGGNVGRVCVDPQTQFSSIAIGTKDPNFTSGVGVGTETQLLIFSGYSGPIPTGFDAGVVGGGDGGTAAGNFVYLQAFDRTNPTQVPAPAAAPLFQAADGMGFAVADVSIAPTGEIALLHYSGTPTDGTATQLYISFLAPATPDAGVGSWQLKQTVQIESVQFDSPRVIWSAASQAFVVSWKYNSAGWHLQFRKLLPDGRSAGGSLVIPLISLWTTYTQGHVATSGSLLGVIYGSGNPYNPFLTLLDSQGNQVGDFVKVSSVALGGNSDWLTVGGTAAGFVSFFNEAGTTYEVFVPTSGDGGVVGGVPDAGAVDGGGSAFAGFSYTSTATAAHAISDDTGGAGGVGTVLLEANGASFLYVTADGTKHLAPSTVISAAGGTQVAITNYHGSFGVSLYQAGTHGTQMVASGCQ